MSSGHYLSNKEYTLYNALTWGIWQSHYRRASHSNASRYQVLFHGGVAALEFFPLIGQIVSLFELVTAAYFKNSATLSSLTHREIQPASSQEPALQFRNLESLPSSSGKIEVILPQDRIARLSLKDYLAPLQRHIEEQYQMLPWPQNIQKIVVFTYAPDGRGDVVAAAKAISIMQKMAPDLIFDWILATSDSWDPQDAYTFLQCEDPSKVQIRKSNTSPPEECPGDFLLTGPAHSGWSQDYIKSKTFREIQGPLFEFLENGSHHHSEQNTFHNLQGALQDIVREAPDSDPYPALHSFMFCSESKWGILTKPYPAIAMGLQEGSGVLLDQSRIDAPLSRGYCSPSYLREFKNVGLQTDILQAMNVQNEDSLPDFDRYSLNSGYAHHKVSHKKFIDWSAMHEKEKHVVIVLNQYAGGSISHTISLEEYREQVFKSEHLDFLSQKGYGPIVLKGEDEEIFILQEARNPQSDRSLTVILRPSFHPDDMRRLQLASERLLATGDNSAAEAWCARCKLYLYEVHGSIGACKGKFFEEQTALAEKISPNLAKALKRATNEEEEAILADPSLSDATLEFCDRIVKDYSFEKVLIGALKRAAWHYWIPELAQIEAETIDKNFRFGLISYLKNPKLPVSPIEINNLPEIGRRVKETIETKLKGQWPPAQEIPEDLFF